MVSCVLLCPGEESTLSVVADGARFLPIMVGDKLLLSAAIGESPAVTEALNLRRADRVTGLWLSFTR